MASIFEVQPDLQAIIESSISTSKSRTAASIAANQITSNNGYALRRVPFKLTCERWMKGNASLVGAESNGPIAIILPVNPTSVQFKMGTRTAEGKTRSGTVLYTWRNKDREDFFDEPELTFTFQSGNIIAVRSPQDNFSSPMISTGLTAFYQFMALIDEDKIIPNGEPGAGQPNFVHISYNSPKFPSLELTGFFNPTGMEFTDSADTPNSVEWTATFTVYKSTPQLGNADELINKWTSVMGIISGTSGEGP